MKYNINELKKAVSYYKLGLGGKVRGSAILVKGSLKNEKAFYSIAPLSRAIHELNGDMKVGFSSKKSINTALIEKVWKTFDNLQTGKIGKAETYLEEFIKIVNKKAGNKNFEKIFKKPEIIITAKEKYFEIKYEDGTKKKLLFKKKWFKKHRWNDLLKTADRILEQGYKANKKDIFGVGFELLPTEKELKLPLEDYLDNFALTYSFALQAAKKSKTCSLGSYTTRNSKLTPMERMTDLSATISGCEYDKKIEEPVFRVFKKLSKELGLNKWQTSTASFGAHGQGYGGKHFFGMTIGYPDLNKKTRWPSPGVMFLKPWWNEQTSIDTRKPKTRLAITETLPLDNYINTCLVDYIAMRKKNNYIKSIIESCDTLFVKSNIKEKYVTNFSVDLKPFNPKKGTRKILPDGGEVYDLMDKEVYKKHKVKAGNYGNFPAGEAFMTPTSIDGRAVSDVVINIDQSYVIPEKEPVVIDMKKGKYKLVSAPKFLKKKLKEQLADSKKLILEYEKSGGLPKRMINQYKRNFDNIGEFAINTNPKAKLSRYLIETEKIAKMMHIAMGSGFEPGTQTTYHWDMVINSPRQLIDVYGVCSKGKKHWIIKKGEFVFDTK